MQKDVHRYFMSEGRDRREVNRLISVLARVNLVYGFTAITQHLYTFDNREGSLPESFDANYIVFRDSPGLPL
jgi:hypothetical protein